jgi:hypothetical protein
MLQRAHDCDFVHGRVLCQKRGCELGIAHSRTSDTVPHVGLRDGVYSPQIELGR